MRFYVLLRGENFASRKEELGHILEDCPPTFGFYTTRVVDAPDANQAVEQATTDVYEELRSFSVEGSGIVTPERVQKVSWFFRRLWPPRGFTFVLNETEADKPALTLNCGRGWTS